MEQIICPVCQQQDEKSTVMPDSYLQSTGIEYTHGHYDENGKYIRHEDPNTYTQGYDCSRGHRFYSITTQASTTLSISETPGQV